MRVPVELSLAFGEPFEKLMESFAREAGLLAENETINSPRFLSRSVVPHVEKLSEMFNRTEGEGLSPYWKASSNPAHLRTAYFLYFMPCNLYRVAAVWAELGRLGFKWKAGESLRAIEFGAGPAAGATGVAAGEKFAKTGLHSSGSWALIEQDKAMLGIGSSWASRYFSDQGFGGWGPRAFHRKIDPTKEFLPRNAPKFNLWVMSYFLNEFENPPQKIARSLFDSLDRHLEEEGIVILVEPALKQQSRKLLELRRGLLEEKERRKNHWLQILLPCLGHQACGALSDPEDWCHEEVSWWRPPYIRAIDSEAKLDRKTLPFSYLVLYRSEKAREEILPFLAAIPAKERQRLVSPARAIGKNWEFYVCGQDGKRRVRGSTPDLERGDILKMRL